MNNNKVGVLIAAVLAVVLLVIGYQIFTQISRQQETPIAPEPQEGERDAPAPPTRTPEEIEIIKNIEDTIISITANGFEPSTVTIKAHDQVFWENDDAEPHAVTGDDWGGVTIQPGKRFMQAFPEAGTYEYSDKLNPDMTGVVVVK